MHNLHVDPASKSRRENSTQFNKKSKMANVKNDSNNQRNQTVKITKYVTEKRV